MIRSEIVKITPEIAAEYLSSNNTNRPVSRTTVDRYAQAIKRGEWALNGEPIILFEGGRLADGQHRCHAVISSGIAIDSVVTYGVDEKTFVTLNAGKIRNGSDVLSIKGEINTNPLASAARSYLMSGLTPKQGNGISAAQIADCVDEHPHLRYWVQRYAGTRNARLMPSSFCGLLAIASEKYGIEKLDTLFDKVASGEGLLNGDPAYVLRERFLVKTGNRLQAGHARAYMIKAINAHVMGKKITMLRYLPDEPMPKIV